MALPVHVAHRIPADPVEDRVHISVLVIAVVLSARVFDYRTAAFRNW